ncbi:MAG: hypothetical protein JO021_17675 [Alphaproteobacteria bacterium]|nr:hypothetical protein [Alphaproteobacteria bacterium]
MRHYCTYLDHNYIPRVLVMADSLRRFGPFRLHVLCLSPLCARILSELAVPEFALIELDALERDHPELLGVKPDRTTIEYFFTLTPYLPAYCLERDAALSEITYLDSDLCFFADPELIFAVIGDRSIGIVPQHLSALWAGASAKCGQFNVGWITYRRTEQGMRCLTEYCRDCLDWCYERLEDDRYADQKYLDRWPTAYSEVAIVDLKGVNVALYNVDGYDVTERDGHLWCDDERLIFYHFHGVYQSPDGQYAVSFPHEHGTREGTVVRRLYRPYIGQLVARRQALLRRFPELGSASMVQRMPAIGGVATEGRADWASDPLTRLRLTHAVALRERVLAGDWAGDPELACFMDIADLLAEAAGATGRLRVLDWGGGFGALAWAARALWPDLAIDWTVRELGVVCDYGAAAFPDTRFEDRDEPEPEPYDVVLAVGALHQAPNWRAPLARLSAFAGRYLILIDLPTAASDDPRHFEERPLAFLPEVRFTAQVIVHGPLLDQLAGAGWQLLRELPSRPVPGAGGVRYRSLVFQHR